MLRLSCSRSYERSDKFEGLHYLQGQQETQTATRMNTLAMPQHDVILSRTLTRLQHLVLEVEGYVYDPKDCDSFKMNGQT